MKYTSFSLKLATIALSGLFIASSVNAAPPPNRLGSISVSSQSGSLQSGTSGDATYNVTVNRIGNGNLHVTLSIISSLPSGVTASFSPSGVINFSGNTPSITVVLTLSSTNSTPSGSTNFTVQAYDGIVTSTSNANMIITSNVGRGGGRLGSRLGRRNFAGATTTATTTLEIASPLETVLDLTSSSTPTSTPVVLPVIEHFKFLKNLRLGMRGNDVLELQNRLASEGFLTSSSTGYFGKLTKLAVIAYQEKYLNDILNPLNLEKGTGFVGPFTRGKLNSY